MIEPRFLAAVAAAWAMFLSAPCTAATTRQFVVSAAIVNGCAVTQAAGSWGRIDFGTVSGLATGSQDANLLLGGISGMTIECTPGTTASLAADNGNNPVSGQRRMVQAGVSMGVPYALFANGSPTPWTTQAIALTFATGSTRQVIPIRGRVTLTW